MSLKENNYKKRDSEYRMDKLVSPRHPNVRSKLCHNVQSHVLQPKTLRYTIAKQKSIKENFY